MIDVIDIVEKYLKDNGYDGLCDDECGCSIDDLMPCSEYAGGCSPAYEVHCVSGEIHYHPTKEPCGRRLG